MYSFYFLLCRKVRNILKVCRHNTKVEKHCSFIEILSTDYNKLIQILKYIVICTTQ